MAKFIIYSGPTITPANIEIPPGEFTLSLTLRGPADSELRLRIPTAFGVKFVTRNGPQRELRSPLDISTRQKRTRRRKLRICLERRTPIDVVPLKVILAENKDNGAKIIRTCLVSFIARPGLKTCDEP